ncbi:hypothetical protein Tco_0538831, partial [Tanacetum coccineum]
MKFLRALLSSWSQVAITLKSNGGLDYLNFDDLYNFDGNPTPVRFVKEGEMNAIPPAITGKFMPTSIHSNFDESQMTYGKKSNDLPETDSNNFVSC